MFAQLKGTPMGTGILQLHAVLLRVLAVLMLHLLYVRCVQSTL